MSKAKSKSQKRKRSKAYTGADAAVTGKKVQRVVVPNRSKSGQWWHENKKRIGLRALFFGILFIFAWLIFALVSWIF